MNATENIKGRRSVRKYKDEKVDRELMKEIVDIARFAPSWANFQVARYTFVDTQDKINEISEKGVNSFTYNQGTLKNAKGVAVISFVKGKSGKLDPTKDDYSTTKADVWETFDTGIACQTFCLAAHEKGVGTCIFGVIDDKEIARIVNLPEDETVACIVTYGYPAEDVKPTSRKSVEEVCRFVD